MKDRTASAIIHGFIAATIEVDNTKSNLIAERAIELSKDYLRGKEIDNITLTDDFVQSVVEMVDEQIEGVVNAGQQGFPNA